MERLQGSPPAGREIGPAASPTQGVAGEHDPEEAGTAAGRSDNGRPGGGHAVLERSSARRSQMRRLQGPPLAGRTFGPPAVPSAARDR